MRITGILCLLALFTLAPTIAAAEAGSEGYAKNCASCHGADGAADTPVAKAMKVQAFKGKALTPAAVIEHVRTDDKHKAQSKKLSDDQLAAIAAFVSKL